MTTQYPVKMSLTLKPVCHSRDLPVIIGVNDNLTTVDLRKTTTINFEFVAADSCKLIVELINKQNQEAVIVESVGFFGITDPKFVWAGVYEPEYPEPWASEQRSQGVTLKPQLCPHTYLSWPGKWTLTFEAPVFTWIHKVQNLGWIYD
jgi:hypothetical protein